MNLLLTSNGIKGKIKEIFSSLLKKPASQNTVGFITTAAYGEEENPTWLYKYRSELQEQGITAIEDLDLRNKKQKELEQLLATKDIIFVNGGNTFFLLDWVNKSGFDKAVRQFLDQGKLYIGVSAGSILCCPTIETAGWGNADPNDVAITNLTGLNLVPFLITPHFSENQRAMITEEASKTTYPVIAINDTQAILVEDNSIKLIGDGEKITFNDFPLIA